MSAWGPEALRRFGPLAVCFRVACGPAGVPGAGGPGRPRGYAASLRSAPRLEARPCPPVPPAPSTPVVPGSLMGSALEGLRLHARKSSPCALKLAQIRCFYACWASFFAPSGPAPVLEAARRTSGWWRWGFCAMRSPFAACRRRVVPLYGAITPIGGGAVAVRGGVAPTSQITSVKNAETGLLVARWSAFWAQRCLSWCVVRTRPRYCEREPSISHVNPLLRAWAGLPRLALEG